MHVGKKIAYLAFILSGLSIALAFYIFQLQNLRSDFGPKQSLTGLTVGIGLIGIVSFYTTIWFMLLTYKGRVAAFLLVLLGVLLQISLYGSAIRYHTLFGHIPNASTFAFISHFTNYSIIMFMEQITLKNILSSTLITLILVGSRYFLNLQNLKNFYRERWVLPRKIAVGSALIYAAICIAAPHLPVVLTALPIEVYYPIELTKTMLPMFSADSAMELNRKAGIAAVDRLIVTRRPIKLTTLPNGLTESPNILIYHMEEVAAGRFEAINNDMPTTPKFKHLRDTYPDRFFVYQHHYANAGCTDVSLTSVYTGLLPSRAGSDLGSIPLIWDYANAINYETFLAIPFDIHWGMHNKKFALADGSFSPQQIFHAGNSGLEISYDASVRDEHVTEAAIKFADQALQNHKKFFGVVNIKLPHGDGGGVQTLGRESLLCGQLKLASWSNYDCSILQLDHELNKMFDYLKEKNLLDTTVVIGFADHGAAQNQHNRARIYNFYNEVLRTPLFMYIPPKVQQRLDQTFVGWRDNIHKTTQNVDVAPTIIDLLSLYQNSKIAKIQDTLSGRSLLRRRPQHPPVVAVNTSSLRFWEPEGFAIIVEGRYKYIFQAGEEYLYDTSNDPKELNNLFTQSIAKQVATSLQRKLDQVRQIIVEDMHLTRIYFKYDKTANNENLALFPRTEQTHLE